MLAFCCQQNLTLPKPTITAILPYYRPTNWGLSMEKLSAIVSRVANQTYNQSRYFLPQQPWWNSLEPSFHKFPDDFYLDFKTQMMIEGTAALDIGLRTVMASLASVCCLPFTLSPKQLAEDYADRFFYQKIGDTHDPAQFFKKPTEKVTVHKHPAGRMDYKPTDGGVCELLKSLCDG